MTAEQLAEDASSLHLARRGGEQSPRRGPLEDPLMVRTDGVGLGAVRSARARMPPHKSGRAKEGGNLSGCPTLPVLVPPSSSPRR